MTRVNVVIVVVCFAACAAPREPKEPAAPPSPPPVEVSGAEGVGFGSWEVDEGALLGTMTLGGEWGAEELTVSIVPLDEGGRELSRTEIVITEPSAGDERAVRAPLPAETDRVRIDLARSRLVTCEAAAEHLLDVVAAQEGAELTGDARQQALAEITANCEQEEWSEQLITCVLDSNTMDDLQACEAFAPTPETDAAEKRPECVEVAQRRTRLAREALQDAEMDEESRALLESNLASVESELMQRCVDESWSDDVITCMREAPDVETLDACVPEREASTQHNPLAGQSECRSAAEHAVELARRDPSMGLADMDEDQRAVVEQMLEEMTGVLAKRCRDERWSDEARGCIQQASSSTELQRCDRLLPAAD